MTDANNTYNPDIANVKQLAFHQKDQIQKPVQNKNCLQSIRAKIGKCTDLLTNYFECIRIYDEQKLQEIRRKFQQDQLRSENMSKINRSQASLIEDRQSDIDHKIQAKSSAKKQIKETTYDQDENPANDTQQPKLKIIKRYAEIYEKSYSQRKSRFGYTFQQVERERELEYIKKQKNCWDEFKRLICCRGGNYLQQLEQVQTDAVSEISQKKLVHQSKLHNRNDTENNIFLFDEENSPKEALQEIALTKIGRKGSKNIKTVRDDKLASECRRSQNLGIKDTSVDNQVRRQNSRLGVDTQVLIKRKQLQKNQNQEYQYQEKLSPRNNTQYPINDETAQQEKAKNNIKTQTSSIYIESARTNNLGLQQSQNIYNDYTNVNLHQSGKNASENTNQSNNYNTNQNNNYGDQNLATSHPNNNGQEHNSNGQSNVFNSTQPQDNQYSNAQYKEQVNSIKTQGLNNNSTPAFNAVSTNNWQYQSMQNANSMVDMNRNIDNQYNTLGNNKNEQQGVAKSKIDKKLKMKKNMEHENNNEDINSNNQVVFFGDDIKDNLNNDGNNYNQNAENCQENQTTSPIKNTKNTKNNKNRNYFEPSDNNFNDEIIMEESQNNSSNNPTNYNTNYSQIGNFSHSQEKEKVNSNLVIGDKLQQNRGYTLDDIPNVQQPKLGAQTSVFKKKRKNKKNLKQQLELNQQQLNEDEIIYQQNFINNEQTNQTSHISSNNAHQMEIEQMKAPQSMFKKKKNKKKNLILQQDDTQEVYNIDQI